MTERTIDVVHVGAASRDLTTDDPRGWRLGGGASYAALTTARLGLATAVIVGVDSEAATAFELDLLREAGVALHLVPLDAGPVFRNVETAAGRRQRCEASAAPLRPAGLPSAWLEATAWSLVPVAGELDDEWAAAVPGSAFVALGWQGLLRNLAPGREVTRRAPAASPLLARADLVGVSRHDLAPGKDARGLSRLLRPSAWLVVTDGPDGGRLVRTGLDERIRVRRYAPVRPVREDDPTGAGDVFLAALLATLIAPGAVGLSGRRDVDAALRFAAAAASFVIEAPGLIGVPHLEAVSGRLSRA